MRVRAAVGAGAMAATLMFAPGVGLASTTEAHAVTKLSHSEAASMFRSSGITWSSSGNCSDRYNSTCTSFEQINLTTVQGAQTLKSASGCALNITGGTETGHASGTYSHWNGYKLDMSLSTCLNNYVTGNFSYIGSSKWQSGSGNVYYREGDHWDITYYNCGGC
ncbi:hypothetical protein AQ490_20450 [Wenjunlia vitaminophila]|uniref:Uncharacterized protein n=1 Tax=Wenjunlia vitaminophila TaxID=76728 RepID=A0A0T6LT81_WENVI|nr:hypothetical protein [Wenjunlia vitaminophila]KRV49367.1 hypothetical protein AQ490_20450 [Wenjunlia vitaminophila]